MKTTARSLLVAGSILCAASLASASDGKTVFDADCAKCHGIDGKGTTKMGMKAGVKDLTDPKNQAELTDEKIAKTIKEGVVVGDKTKMKGFPDLSADDVKALVSYVKSLKK